MYCDVNFKSKKALKEAVAAGQAVGVFQAGPFGNGDYANGTFAVEGPHYPEPHKWYGTVTVQDGRIVKVK
jgi:hypothetical protein